MKDVPLIRIVYRPFLNAAFIYLFGLILGWELELPPVYFFIAFGVLFAACIVICLFSDQLPGAAKWLAAGAVFCLAVAMMLGVKAQTDKNIYGKYDITCRITASEQNGNRSVLTGRDVVINGKAIQGGIFLTFYDAKVPEVDDTIRATAKLDLPRKTPYRFGFSDAQYCTSQNILYRATCSSFTLTGHKDDLWSFFRSSQKSISAKIDDIFGSSSAPIIKALIIGDTSGILDYDTERFVSSGISHVLALSGLHIGIFTSLLYFLLKRLKIWYYPRLCITIFAVVFYVALTGFRITAVRAAIICIGALFANEISVQYDRLTCLSLAFFVLALWNPGVIFDIGFQFSFAAVFAICCFTIDPLNMKNILKQRPNRRDKIIAMFSVPAVITAVTLPMSANVNNYIWLPSILLNIVVIPFVGIAVPVLMISTLVGSALPFASNIVAPIGKLFVEILRTFSDGSAAFGGLGITLTSTFQIVYIVVLGGMFLISPFCVKYRNKAMRAAAGAFAAIFAVAVFIVPHINGDDLTLTFLSGGDRNGAVITTKEGGSAVIDAGTDISGYTEKNGIYPKVTIISAKDLYYTKNLDRLINEGRSGKLYASEKVAHMLGTKYDYVAIEPLKTGDIVEIDNNTAVEIIYVNKYDGAMVMRLTRGGHGICTFMGNTDLYDEGLISADARADILETAKNAGKKTTGELLIEKVAPKYAIISSSGKPSGIVLDRLKRARVYETEDNGAVTFRLDGEKLTAEAMYETW